MESTIVGALRSDENYPDFFESEPFSIPYFDNMKLKIGFVEAEHQLYLETADKVLGHFIKLNSKDKISDSELVMNYYKETLKYGYTKPLHILASNDIWNFVKPKEIIIHWDENEDFYVCVSCACAWEEEHGLQLVFKNGQSLTRASGHDGHFSD